MCVRYTLHKTDAALAVVARALHHAFTPPEWVQPRYNVALTHVMPVVAAGDTGPELRGMRWGLVPAAARGRPAPHLLPNARAETAPHLPAFRAAIAHRRCLVPANGFYEWLTQGTLKRPHLFTLRDEEPFAFAGLWEPADPGQPETFGILTTEPNALVAPLHHRMPVLLTADTMPRWLGAAPLAPDDYTALIRPLPADRLAVREVNRFVSNARHEGPACHAPPDPPAPELPLDFS